MLLSHTLRRWANPPRTLPTSPLLSTRRLHIGGSGFPTDDLYRILQVQPTGTHAELKKSFYRLSRLHHPDAPGGGDREQFREVVEAWRYLSDKHKRRLYDQNRQSLSSASGSSGSSPQRYTYGSPHLSRRRTSAPAWMTSRTSGSHGSDGGGTRKGRRFDHAAHFKYHYGDEMAARAAGRRTFLRNNPHAAEGHDRWASVATRLGPVLAMVVCMVGFASIVGHTPPQARPPRRPSSSDEEVPPSVPS